MPKLYELTCEHVGGGPIDLSRADMQQAISAVMSMNKAVALKHVEMVRTATSPLTYQYQARTDDGRIWDETWIFEDILNPHTTFDIGGDWHRTELAPHRAVRGLFEDLVRSYGVTYLLVKFKD